MSHLRSPRAMIWPTLRATEIFLLARKKTHTSRTRTNHEREYSSVDWEKDGLSAVSGEVPISGTGTTSLKQHRSAFSAKWESARNSHDLAVTLAQPSRSDSLLCQTEWPGVCYWTEQPS